MSDAILGLLTVFERSSEVNSRFIPTFTTFCPSHPFGLSRSSRRAPIVLLQPGISDVSPALPSVGLCPPLCRSLVCASVPWLCPGNSRHHRNHPHDRASAFPFRPRIDFPGASPVPIKGLDQQGFFTLKNWVNFRVKQKNFALRAHIYPKKFLKPLPKKNSGDAPVFSPVFAF